MSLLLNTNVSALIAQQGVSFSNRIVERSFERLSSGSRINRAADDAAGYTVSENLKSQIRKMEQNQRNVQDGISMVQIAESALNTIANNLQRVRELTTTAANDTNSVESRAAIEVEITALLEDNDRIARSTEFNDRRLLDGTIGPNGALGQSGSALIQIGPNSSAQTNVIDITAALGDATSGGNLAGSSGINIVGGGRTFANIASIDFEAFEPGTPAHETAKTFLNDIDQALDEVVLRRSMLGSFQNQLESVTENLSASIENFSASNSRIRDLDVAQETATLTQYQILQQAGVSVLAQANRLPQQIVDLISIRN